MATDTKKAWVTELHVPMDCNGCVHRIKKALHRVNGVHDVRVDLPQEKLTVVGSADPEALVKAIKKTRRTATICSHHDPNASEPPSAAEPEASVSAPAAEATDVQPPNEAPPAEASSTDAPPKETPAPEASKATPEADVVEVGMAQHHPHGQVVGEHLSNHPATVRQVRHEAPYYVIHSYNTYRPSAYASEHGYLQSPPEVMRYHSVEAYGDGYYQNRGNEGYGRSQESDGGYYQNRGNEGYNRNLESDGVYYQNRGGDGNQIGSMFSDENPNACTIV